MNTLFDLAMDSFKLYLSNWATKRIEYTEDKLVDLIREFQQYSAIASPLLPLLAEYGDFYNYKNLCALFMPVFLRNRKLDISINNRDIIVQLIKTYLFNTETLENVIEITFLKVEFINDESFLKRFPRLEVLVLDSWLDDTILEAVVQYFPDLRVLDGCSRNVEHCTVTDRGLEQLARLKKLKSVFLGNMYDKDVFDNMKYSPLEPPRYTGKGVADLMEALPELQRFICPGYIMKEALHIMKLSQTRLPLVKSIYLSGRNVLVDLTANEVCPNLERICVSAWEEHESVIVKALSAFPHLKQLHITLEGNFSSFDGFCQKLSLLELRFDCLEFQSLIAMGAHCSKVTVLSLRGKQLYPFRSDLNCLDGIRSTLFPSLDTLIYDIDDIRGVYLFLHKDSGLRHFHLLKKWSKYKPRGAYTFSDLLQNFEPGCGLWPQLETFGVHQIKLQYNDPIVIRLADALPSLERIVAKYIAIENGPIYVSSRGQRVTLSRARWVVYPTDYPVFGFPDLSKRLCK